MTETTDPQVIYLAPACCADPYGDTGRLWCEDDVWPCSDCPEPSKARGVRYRREPSLRDAVDELRQVTAENGVSLSVEDVMALRRDD